MGVLCCCSNPYLLVPVVFLISLIFLYPRYFWRFYHTAGRDLRLIYRAVRLSIYLRKCKSRDVGLPTLFQEVCRRNPEKVALIFEDQKWTFKELDDYSNRVANYFKEEGIKHGDCVALFMENRLEYVGIWLGLVKLGAIVALLNCNLRSKSLLHCYEIVDANKIICGTQDQDEISDVISGDIKVYVQGASSEKPLTIEGAMNLDSGVKSASSVTPSEINDVKFRDKIFYIYTSGTTGLPKAAIVVHSRAIMTPAIASYMVGVMHSDVLYSPLPLYHTATGLFGVGLALTFGTTVVLRRKFSSSQFWNECIKHRVTVCHYIGEICRYILNTPEKAIDTQHQVRMIFGNGLRSQIWSQFQSRFKIDQIIEIYGATEGNAGFVNLNGQVGSIGFIPCLIPSSLYPLAIIKVDEDGAPMRDQNGLCIRCEAGEPGELVGRIIKNNVITEFRGYVDKKATQSKIIYNVWKTGDRAVFSGDILVMDEFKNVFFKDRSGDTFRWRGENVSTTEVENVISSLVDKKDVVVFGVEIPGAEGRCGMACIMDPNCEVSIPSITTGIVKELPTYARPLFIRRLSQLEMTGTFKVKKNTLKDEGYNTNKITDDLFFFDAKTSSYGPLTQQIYLDICEGRSRL